MLFLEFSKVRGQLYIYERFFPYKIKFISFSLDTYVISTTL